jgi:hypothetical protein
MRIPLLLAAALLLTGCSSAHQDQVLARADQWAAAIRAGDWETACGMLAPVTIDALEKSAGKPCTEALPEEASPPPDTPPRVQAYGKAAQAAWSGETLFLGEFDGRWLVWAAGCTPTGKDRPHDCDISGG